MSIWILVFVFLATWFILYAFTEGLGDGMAWYIEDHTLYTIVFCLPITIKTLGEMTGDKLYEFLNRNH